MKVLYATLLTLTFIPDLMAQIQNQGFELWDTTFTPAYEQELINVFNIPDPVSGVIHGWSYGTPYGICRTTDAYEGDYSLIVHNWYGYAREHLDYRDTISYKPEYLSGFYKYIGEENKGQYPHGIGEIVLLTNTADTLATALHFFDTTSVYIPFEIGLDYRSGGEPDSIFIKFTNADQACFQNIVCNFLYLDKLSFSPNPTVGISPVRKNDLFLYPNPTSGGVNIPPGFQLLDITNLQGQLFTPVQTGNNIDLSNLQPGFYILRLISSVNKELYFRVIARQ